MNSSNQIKKLFLFGIIAFLSITVPASAHNLPMGGSRWSFGNNAIVGFVDLKSSLLSEIKGIKEGHYDLDSASAGQLQQLATQIIQPYVSKKLAIAVNDKTYPITVDNLVRSGIELYTIYLSVHDVSFNKPVNEVKIVYSLLQEETNNEHVNLAYGYVSGATGDALQRVFNTSPPAFQATLDSKTAAVWEVSVPNTGNAPSARQSGAGPVQKKILKNPEEKIVAANPASPVIREDAQEKKRSAHGTSDSLSASPSSTHAGGASSDGAESSSAPQIKRRSIWTTLRQFVPLGIEHILTGYDHIAFLLAIIVIELSIGQILKIVTAFTAAHSITLLLSALQIVRVNSTFVECVIAFSICYVALANIITKKADHRWLIAFGFGLIHGFGFASALRELIVGKANLLVSVFCFNIGVEVGQLMLLVVLLPTLYLLKKQVGARIVNVSTSAIVFVIGFAWLIERAFRVKLLWF